MFRKLALTALTAVALSAGPALASGGSEGHVENYNFSFDGPFGSFDQHQLQRGLQIYTEICSSCHGMRYVPIRTLSDEGGPGILTHFGIAGGSNDESSARERHFPTNAGTCETLLFNPATAVEMKHKY